MAMLGFNDRISTEVPLHTAVKDKTLDMEFIRGLLEGGQDPNKRDVLGYAALHHVVTHADADPSVVPLFVEYGADVNIEHPTNVKTPLILLLKHRDCNSSMAMQLIRSGANVNAPDRYPDSWPLNLAILNKRCNLGVIREMIDRGARVHGSGLLEPNDHTALHLASVMQRLDVVKCLLRLNKRAVRASDSSNRTPLLLMLKKCSRLEDVKDLVEIILELWSHGAVMNHSDVEGATPLMAYLESDSDSEDALYVVQTLLDLGADVNRNNRNNRNPLDIVLMKRNLNLLVIKALLARGAYENRKAVIQLEQAITRYKSRRDPSSEECAKLLIKYSLLNEDNLECIASEGLEIFMPCEEFREYTAACFAEMAMSQSVMISDNVSLYRILTKDRLQKENERLNALQDERQRGVKVNLNRRAYSEDGSYRLSESTWFGVGLTSFDCLDQDCLDVVTHNLLSFLVQRKFPLYEDIISSLFSYSEKDLLIGKLNQLTVYTYYKVKEQSDPLYGKRITLNSYCVVKLCKYLSVSDVRSLTLAYYHIFESV